MSVFRENLPTKESQEQTDLKEVRSFGGKRKCKSPEVTQHGVLKRQQENQWGWNKAMKGEE